MDKDEIIWRTWDEKDENKICDCPGRALGRTGRSGVWWYRSPQGIIWRVERVNEYNRNEEDWIQLIGAYEKLGD